MPLLEKHDIYLLANQLPSVSNAAAQLVGIIDDPDTPREKIVDLLKIDEMLFADCFKQANSAAIGAFRKFVTINEIVDVLGFAHIKRVALYTAAKSVVDDPRLWHQSVFIALAAEFLAKKNYFDQKQCDAMYMAALFQNYGSFLLKYSFPNEYRECCRKKEYTERLAAEKEEFGYNSLEISALLLKQFGIPDYVTDIIENQSKVYTETATKENFFIEIGRILHEIQDQDIDDLRKSLADRAIYESVVRSGISLIHVNEDMVSTLQAHTNAIA